MKMDIRLEKLELMKLLKETEKLSVATYIKNIFVKEKKDWWDELPKYVKERIEAGEQDIAEGRVHSYEELKQFFGWK
jgi:predicted transcriptional regulator